MVLADGHLQRNLSLIKAAEEAEPDNWFSPDYKSGYTFKEDGKRVSLSNLSDSQAAIYRALDKNLDELKKKPLMGAAEVAITSTPISYFRDELDLYHATIEVSHSIYRCKLPKPRLN